ncbi:MAG: hypothetical protein Q8L23_17975 [Caulobacter sp.]|nr:hypothetical protein [Caulobacter sp.]
MTFELNPGKLLGMFWPVWALLAVSLLVSPHAWADQTLGFALVAAMPLAATTVLWGFGRRRWRLELTPAALVHHTLGRTEAFEWTRMGQIGVSAVPGLDLIAPATLHFAYAGEGAQGAVGRAPGRRLLCVFGDGGTRRLVRQIEDYRRLHGAG